MMRLMNQKGRTMPRVSSGAIRALRRTRCMETLLTGGDTAWSADGKTVYAMRGDIVKAIQVGDPLNSLSIGSESDGLKVCSLCLNADSTALAISYTNGLIREVDVTTSPPREIRSWRSFHTSPILCMAYSPDSSLLATGSADFSVLVWEVRNHRVTAKLSGPSVVSSLLFRSSQCLVVGYGDGIVRIFTVGEDHSCTLSHEPALHSSRITCICADNKWDRVLVVSRDKTASIVDIASGQKKGTVVVFEAVEGAVFVDSSRLFTVGEEGILKEWNPAKSKLIRSLQISAQGLESVSYNESSGELLVVTSTHNLVFIHAETWEVRREIVGMHDEIFSVALMGDGHEYIVVASNSPELQLYSMDTFTCKLFPGHTSSVVSLAVPYWDSTLLASCAKDSNIIMWRLSSSSSTLSPLAICSGHTGSPSSVSFSHHASRSFLVSVAYDTMLKLWPLSSLPTSTSQSVNNVPHLSCASTLKAHGKDATAVDVAPNDSLLVTAGIDKTAKLWGVDTGKMQLGIVGTLSGHRRGVWDARFSPTGEKVATCSGDGFVRVFAVSDRSILATLEGHTSAVLKVLFVNKGSQLLSADSGGIIRIWEVKSGVCELVQEAHDDKIWSVCASREEDVYVSAGSDGKVVLWEDASEAIEREEMEKAQKTLREEQKLDNLLSGERFVEALQYALGLDRPHAAIKIVSALDERDSLRSAVSSLDSQQLLSLVQFISRWNTNTKTSHAAQTALNAVLKEVPPERLLEINGIGGLLAELLPYTKRHCDRLNKARQDVSLLSFTWKQMRIAN